VFIGQGNQRRHVPHKPNEYDSCGYDEMVRTRPWLHMDEPCGPHCHYVHAQDMPNHVGPCITCADAAQCAVNLVKQQCRLVPIEDDPDWSFPPFAPRSAMRISGRMNGKNSIHEERVARWRTMFAEEQILEVPHGPGVAVAFFGVALSRDVDRTFENETRLNPRKAEDWVF
jgi:hypothetical protein